MKEYEVTVARKADEPLYLAVCVPEQDVVNIYVREPRSYDLCMPPQANIEICMKVPEGFTLYTSLPYKQFVSALNANELGLKTSGVAQLYDGVSMGTTVPNQLGLDSSSIATKVVKFLHGENEIAISFKAGATLLKYLKGAENALGIDSNKVPMQVVRPRKLADMFGYTESSFYGRTVYDLYYIIIE